MKNIFLVLQLCMFLLIACSPSKKLGSTSDVIKGDAIDFKSLIDSFKSANRFTDSITNNGQSASEITSKIPETRNDLDKMRTVITLHSGNNSAGITIPGFGGMTLGKGEANLNVYYIETKVVVNNNDSIVYGCGYSVHYLFKKMKKGLDISKLPVVAASVQLDSKKTEVFYSLQSYGIRSLNLVKYFKPTINKDFDVEGFGVVQSSIDGIHNILGDSALSNSVKFTPEIIKFVKAYQLEQ